MSAIHPQTLLLVDDEPNILSALKRLFRRDGYTILATDNADEAMRMLAVQPVDVILSDQRMPGISGVEFLRRVKASYPETVRIVLSGYTDLQFITDAINEGAIYKFLTKPWDDGQLREQVREAFRGKEIADENLRLSDALRQANVGLQALIEDKERQAKRLETVLDTLQEVLQLIPWPIVGIDEDGMVALSNPAADAQLGQSGAPLLGKEVRTGLPEQMRDWLLDTSLIPQRVQLAGMTYRVIFRHMGQHSRSRGALLAFLPCEVSN
jgi:YesN/AraC family two-component response regulator